ncbi:MAG TPA: tRNA lysidine(34) synthetase TilS, partial [Chitinophagales bacterium]|nr:tRNA lysidine(34) synthetase TilS [Chitinophagales bacterium]
GIPQRQCNIIRPLLCASRVEIEEYLKENKLQYREDSSNASDKYTRNKIRHNIIPLLKEINPALESAFAEKIELFTDLEAMYDKEVKKISRRLFDVRGNDIYMPIVAIKKEPKASTVMFEYLKDYGFNNEQVADILASVDGEPGKQYLTNTARIIKDRKFFILTKLQDTNNAVQVLGEVDKHVTFGEKKLTKSEATPVSKVKITADKNIAIVDAVLLEYPLTVRKWKQGDYFYPFGMKMKKKKLKKFLIDEKVPLHEKENVWVVESNKRLVWVIGYRIDERFKVTGKTKKVVKLSI